MIMLNLFADILPPSTLAARQAVIDAHGFDLAHSPRFIEALLIRMIGGDATAYCDTVDCVTPCGRRVEIKTSKRWDGSKAARPHVDRYSFTSLRGVTGRGKQADVFVLAGVDVDGLRLWTIPAARLEYRPTLSIRAVPMKRLTRCPMDNPWAPFETTAADLPAAVRAIPFERD